ncbi:MAG: hypothetical protein CMH57_02860 [Myxococcales bacterium]|nr:hypothetical protein [Myxococcales bacterium]
MTRLKVLHISTQSATAFRFVLPFARWLRAHEHEVHLASSELAYPDAESFVAPIRRSGLPFHPIAIPRAIEPLADLKALAHAWTLIRRERFDIVHTHNAKAGVIGRLAARLAGCPVVIHTNHGLPFFVADRFTLPENIAHLLLEASIARLTDVIFVVSVAEQEKMARFNITPARDVVQIGQGIDLSHFDPQRVSAERLRHLRTRWGIPPKAPVVGTIARLVHHKGVDVLLRAVARLSSTHPDLHTLIIGDGDELTALKRLARELGVATRVTFTGYLKDPRDTRDAYRLMTLFCLPTCWESFGVVFAEAMAMQIPIVATDLPPINAVVSAGETGLLAPRDDAAGFSRAIARLLDDPDLRAAFGAAGRRRAQRLFSEERLFSTMLEHYLRVSTRPKLGDPHER